MGGDGSGCRSQRTRGADLGGDDGEISHPPWAWLATAATREGTGKMNLLGFKTGAHGFIVREDIYELG